MVIVVDRVHHIGNEPTIFEPHVIPAPLRKDPFFIISADSLEESVQANSAISIIIDSVNEFLDFLTKAAIEELISLCKPPRVRPILLNLVNDPVVQEG